MSNRKNRTVSNVAPAMIDANATINTTTTPQATPPKVSNAIVSNTVESLLASLAASKGDTKACKGIRRALRSKGYYGGTRQRSHDVARGATRSTIDANGDEIA